MGFYGQPARDPISVADQAHLEMMERGSYRLLKRIHAYQTGKPAPAARNDDLIWSMEYEAGVKVRAAQERPFEHPLADRAPCARCGVRVDRHAEAGCAHYRRGRVA